MSYDLNIFNSCNLVVPKCALCVTLYHIIYAVIRVTIYVFYNAHDIFSLFGDI